jgi:lipopolysaccharide/colanic/teichoic acid biosynthesis glycosyltransferase
MNLRSLRQKKIIIVAADAQGFANVVRNSQTAGRNHTQVIPIECTEEIVNVLPGSKKALVVLDPQLNLNRSQEDFINEALSRGAQWCTLRMYEGIQKGVANIRCFSDMLEWVHWQDHSLAEILWDKAKCIARRLTALGLLIALSPLMSALWVSIRISSPGPALFRQMRVGHHGKQFELVKFRTMHLNAEANGPQWSNGDKDPRLFPLGKFLRKTHLDELPQLWNILCGHLCFVGPRPERPEFHDWLKNHIPHFNIRTRVRPGLTGWAQLRSGYASSIEESKTKVAHDIFFMRSKRGLLVASIIIETARKCLFEIVLSAVNRTKKLQ